MEQYGKVFYIDKITNRAISIEKKSFQNLGYGERKHLQEWIAANPDILGERLLIIQKEFSGWSDTKERLDLLAIDERGNIVIIENKLDDSGRDVVWQALKYASYCAPLTKPEICEIYQKYLGSNQVASEKIKEFFDKDYDDISLNPPDGVQRIILVAANFRIEVTSTAIWLKNYHNVDITCVKVTPYQDGERIYIDSEKILPLQDAGDYQVRLGVKHQEDVAQKNQTTAREEMNREFWTVALPKLREKLSIFKDITQSKVHFLFGASGYSGIYFEVCIFTDKARAGLYIATDSLDKNKDIYNKLECQKDDLDREFGSKLFWQQPEKKTSRISISSSEGCGIYNTEKWDLLIEFLSSNIAKFHSIFKPALDKIMKG